MACSCFTGVDVCRFRVCRMIWICAVGFRIYHCFGIFLKHIENSYWNMTFLVHNYLTTFFIGQYGLIIYSTKQYCFIHTMDNNYVQVYTVKVITKIIIINAQVYSRFEYALYNERNCFKLIEKYWSFIVSYVRHIGWTYLYERSHNNSSKYRKQYWQRKNMITILKTISEWTYTFKSLYLFLYALCFEQFQLPGITFLTFLNFHHVM